MHSVENITVQELEDLCHEYASHRNKIRDLEAAITEEKQSLLPIETKIQAYFEFYGKTSYKSKAGDFGLRVRTSFKTPKTEEAKRAFFQFLEKEGIFWSTAGVNSQTLNALCNAQLEACAQLGEEFNIPGIEAPETFIQVVFKR